jgi:hypothetical protein
VAAVPAEAIACLVVDKGAIGCLLRPISRLREFKGAAMADAQDPYADTQVSTTTPHPPVGGHEISFAEATWFDSARVNCERGELCGEEGVRLRVAATEEKRKPFDRVPRCLQ